MKFNLYIYLFINISLYTHIYQSIHIYTYLSIYIYQYIYIYIYIYIYLFLYIYIYIYCFFYKLFVCRGRRKREFIFRTCSWKNEYIYIYIYILFFYKLFVCRVRRFAGIHFQNLFLKKWTWCQWKQAVSDQVSLYGSPGQTTMTMSRVSKFCARGRSQSINIFHLDSTYLGILGVIEPWPECQP